MQNFIYVLEKVQIRNFNFFERLFPKLCTKIVLVREDEVAFEYSLHNNHSAVYSFDFVVVSKSSHALHFIGLREVAARGLNSKTVFLTHLLII